MLQSLFEILRDKWERRGQVVRLARFELLKRSSNSVLSWAWLLIKPLVTIFCYWFTIYIGFRHGRDLGEGAPSYILWLTAGVVPWFFMSEILNGGTGLMHTYNYLVDKVRFPLAAIPSVYAVTSLVVQLVLQLLLLGTYLVCGQTIGIHLLQAPFLIVLFFVLGYGVPALFFAFGYQPGSFQLHKSAGHSHLLAFGCDLQHGEPVHRLTAPPALPQPGHLFCNKFP